MNFHFSSKRIHSPTDDYSTTTIKPDQLHARKKVMTDDMFTNKMAGLSLAHSTDTDINHFPTDSLNDNDNDNDNRSQWSKDLVERVDDIDQYLDNERNDMVGDGDTYLGATPELVGVAMGNTILPFERIPGATGLRIPDFVLHANGTSSNDELAWKHSHQHHDHNISSSPSPLFQATDTDQCQPMDLD